MPEPDALSTDTAFAIDFNLQQVPAALGLPVTPAAAAAMLAITEGQFAAYVEQVRAEMAVAAGQMLAQPWAVSGMHALRSLLPPGGTIMAAGDSITTYRRGYAELLRAMMSAAFPADGFRLLNSGQSGYTSTHAREYVYTQLIAQQPDLVFLMYGANDCKHFGNPQNRTLVSAAEYADNIAFVVDAFLTRTPARVILLTPPPIVEEAANNLPDFATMQMTWNNCDIEACAAAVRQVAERTGQICVDLTHAFGPRPDPALYLADGLHPGPAGHRFILEQILTALTRRKA